MRMGINTAEVVRPSQNKVMFNPQTYLDQVGDLSNAEKNKIQMEQAVRNKLMKDGLQLMANHELFFDDLHKALLAMHNDNFGLAEVCIENQINIIKRVSSKVDLNDEQKWRCLTALQILQTDLPFIKTRSGMKNNYVPQISRDMLELSLKEQSLGLKEGTLLNKCLDTQYYTVNQCYKSVKLYDHAKIKETLKEVSQNHTALTPDELHAARKRNNFKVENGLVDLGSLPFEKPQLNIDINKIYSSAMVRFDASRLSKDIPELFNFVKDSLEKQDPNLDHIDTQTLHNIVTGAIQNIVEYSSQRAMMQESVNDGRSM